MAQISFRSYIDPVLESQPSKIWIRFIVLHLIFLSLVLRLLDLLHVLVESNFVIPCFSCPIIHWTTFRLYRMPMHVSWQVLSRGNLLKKRVKFLIGFLSNAVSNLSSYFWPIRPFSQTLITLLSLIIWVNWFVSSHQLVSIRSSLGPICEVPRSCLKTVGDRSFVSAIPNLWNQLPLSVCLNNSLSSFKNGLKRYYFKQYYMCWSLSSS